MASAKPDRRQLSLAVAPPIEIDGEVIVRHQGGLTQVTTLWGIEENEVHLKFGMAGVRVALLYDTKPTKRSSGLKAGTFREKNLAFWRVDNLDLERLRASAKKYATALVERVKEARYGKKEDR